MASLWRAYLHHLHKIRTEMATSSNDVIILIQLWLQGAVSLIYMVSPGDSKFSVIAHLGFCDRLMLRLFYLIFLTQE